MPHGICIYSVNKKVLESFKMYYFIICACIRVPFILIISLKLSVPYTTVHIRMRSQNKGQMSEIPVEVRMFFVIKASDTISLELGISVALSHCKYELISNYNTIVTFKQH